MGVALFMDSRSPIDNQITYSLPVVSHEGYYHCGSPTAMTIRAGCHASCFICEQGVRA
jgi:hypothetical protein